MTQDNRFAEYEGLAVSTAGKVYRQWGKALAKRGVTLEEVCQESRAALLELLPKLDNPAYGPEQRRAYIVKSVRGRLLNFVKRASRNGDTRDRPDPPTADPGDLIDLHAALATLDPTIKAMVLARYGGSTYKTIGQEHNISAGTAAVRVKIALATLKKIMHA